MALLIPWFQTSGLQNWDNKILLFLKHQVYVICYSDHRKLIQWTSLLFAQVVSSSFPSWRETSQSICSEPIERNSRCGPRKVLPRRYLSHGKRCVKGAFTEVSLLSSAFLATEQKRMGKSMRCCKCLGISMSSFNQANRSRRGREEQKC